MLLLSTGAANIMQILQEHLLEQCSLTGGRLSSLAISVFFILRASSIYTLMRFLSLILLLGQKHYVIIKLCYNADKKKKKRKRRQTFALKQEELELANVTIFTYRFAFYPLSSQGTGSNSRTTAKGFELGIHNLPSLIHLDLGGKNNRTHQFIISIVSELQTVFRLYNECTVKKNHTQTV